MARHKKDAPQSRSRAMWKLTASAAICGGSSHPSGFWNTPARYEGMGWSLSTTSSIPNRYCAGYLFCVCYAATQVSDRRNEQSKGPNQNARLYTSFSPSPRLGLEKHVEDGLYDSCTIRCNTRTHAWGNERVMKGHALRPLLPSGVNRRGKA